MGTFLYFAYGSNMLIERLRAPGRCPSAAHPRLAWAKGYRVVFWKKGKDGSGKATLIKSANLADLAIGVVFDISEHELWALDQAEGAGHGYDRDDAFKLVVEGDVCATACTYIAPHSHRDDKLIPYDWYLDLVLAGAHQNKLPDRYIAALRAVAVQPDPAPESKERLAALSLLEQAGYQSTKLTFR